MTWIGCRCKDGDVKAEHQLIARKLLLGTRYFFSHGCFFHVHFSLFFMFCWFDVKGMIRPLRNDVVRRVFPSQILWWLLRGVPPLPIPNRG